MAKSSAALKSCFILLVVVLGVIVNGSQASRWESTIKMPNEKEDDKEIGTRWAVLVAGSRGYGNYRHQADVCHAYQLLRKGGLKEENIVVFMYDDIATSDLNPKPGVIINHPQGQDVYAGVPKVLYIEACESGSIFEGLMPEDLNIYVTTASNAEESSWGTYCPGMDPPPPPEYITCLGDLYSIAWLEDSETHNLKKETIKEQYESVKYRTSNYNTYNAGSHVMEYGNRSIKAETLYLYQGFDPATATLNQNNIGGKRRLEVVNQSDADLLFLGHRYNQLKSDESGKKEETLNQIKETMTHRTHLDTSIRLVGDLLFGPHKGSSTLSVVRSSGLPLVDDWGCLKAMVRVFESHCGSLTQYGMKHMRAFANICNSEISVDTMKEVSMAVCNRNDLKLRIPSSRGYSA
ncbi:hypothetical protein MKX01_008148 [Papaver californicum]|nr:hypothetical protein MKX01_008148 [Papaver californicum]